MNFQSKFQRDSTNQIFQLLSASQDDPSIYTGLSGIALIMHKMGEDELAISLLEEAKAIKDTKIISWL